MRHVSRKSGGPSLRLIKFRKAEVKRYEQFVKQWPDELEGHGHWLAALGCMGFTYADQIDRLKEWLEINNPKIAKQIQ